MHANTNIHYWTFSEYFSKIAKTAKTPVLIVILTVIVSLLQFKQTIAQQVSPFQTGHFMPAFANVRDFTKMSPGLVILPYNYFAWGNEYVDKEGIKHDKIFLSDINPELPSAVFTVDIKTVAAVPAFFWGSKFTILGGATYVAGITPSYYWSSAFVALRPGGGTTDTVFTNKDNSSLSGFGDLSIIPLGLSWGWDKFDVSFYYGFTAPTGRYKTGADDNIGLGFWTNQFQGYGYWYPYKSQATAYMFGVTYEINSKIKGEDVNPGNRFSLEYGWSQYIDERVEFSIMGGHNWQLSDDKGDDVYWDASYHDRKSTVAFGLAYWAVRDRLYIEGKYMVDYGVRQRFLLQGFMLNIIFITNALDGAKKHSKIN